MARGRIVPIALAAALAGFAAGPSRARACSVNQSPAVIDPALRASDPTPPTLRPIVGVDVVRGKGPRSSGCSTVVSSCDDLGQLIFSVTATDDVTPAETLGYRFTLVAGTLPRDLVLPAAPLQAQSANVVMLAWLDGATDDQEGMDFTLAVVAVDGAGNESAPQTVRIEEHLAGCRLAARADVGTTGLVVALALLSLAGRRRRASSSLS